MFPTWISRRHTHLWKKRRRTIQTYDRKSHFEFFKNICADLLKCHLSTECSRVEWIFKLFVFSQKRRSARNTKRKKYMDDIDLQLSEEEKADKEDGEGMAVKPVQFFVVSMVVVCRLALLSVGPCSRACRLVPINNRWPYVEVKNCRRSVRLRAEDIHVRVSRVSDNLWDKRLNEG